MRLMSVNYNRESRISKCLEQVIDKDTIFVCVGTPRCIGDAVAPYIGNKLIEKGIDKNKVIGTKENPVTRLNVRKIIEEINIHHGDKNIIAIDACVGVSSKVGTVILDDEGVQPSGALTDEFPFIGDYGMKIVTTNNVWDIYNVCSDDIERMAEKVSDSIIKVYKNISRH